MENLLTLRPETLSGLAELVRANLDSAAALRECAGGVDGHLMTELFTHVATERSGFAEELSAYLSLNDVEAPTEGAWLESLRRVWIDLRARFNGGDLGVVLIELERAEAMIKGKYEEVLRLTAGSPANATLTRHYAMIKKTHDAICDLRTSLR